MQFCAVPRCGVLVERGRCRAHAVESEHARRNYAIRGWYRTDGWRALRAEVMRDQAYTCALCGAVLAALEIDHIRKHDGDIGRFWDRANLQAICKPCHTRKTRRGK